MNDPIDINVNQSKIKQLWKKHKAEIAYYAALALCAGVVTGGTVYMFKAYKSAFTGGFDLPTVTNEGVKHTYALGGPDSPMTYQLTEKIADAYNRAGKLVNPTKAFGSKNIGLKADKFDMAAWNYVAQMTRDHIAAHGPIPTDNIFNHYLTRI